MMNRMISSLAAIAFVHAAAADAVDLSTVLSATTSNYFTQTGTGSNSSVVEVEGSGLGSNYAAFGVVEFKASALRADTVGSVQSLTLSLTVDVPGSLYNSVTGAQDGLSVYLNTGSAADLTSSSKLRFDPASTGGVTSEFTSLSLLGKQNVIVSTGNGSTDRFSFDLSNNARAQQAVQKALSGGGSFQLVLAPAVDYVFTSFAGASSTDTNPLTGKAYSAPQLAVGYSAVPEPNSAVLLGLGSLAGLFLLRRRRLA